MDKQHGLTLLELIIAMAVMAVLASFGFAQYESSTHNTNLRVMRDTASKLALAQQQHRQTYGRYAERLKAKGEATDNTLVFAELEQFNIRITQATYSAFHAELSAKSPSGATKKQCAKLQVSSDLGFLSYATTDDKGNSTSKECLGHG
ncbi:type IV pilin protein [Limnobacter sp.]|uniref:type IV pilin protein n=1 Tax=Limnobacter sp. TaxID=2003368 RepID=UPI00351805BF